MLIKLPKTGPGVRFLESSCIKSIAVRKIQDTTRDLANFQVQLLNEAGQEIGSVNCVSVEAAENLMDTIVTICNNPGTGFSCKKETECEVHQIRKS